MFRQAVLHAADTSPKTADEIVAETGIPLPFVCDQLSKLVPMDPGPPANREQNDPNAPLVVDRKGRFGRNPRIDAGLPPAA